MSRINEIIRLNMLLPMAEAIKGTCLVKWYKEIEKMSTWSRDEISSWQNDCLRKIVRQAYYHTIYYHRLFDTLNINPEDIKSTDDLKLLPVLTKDDVREHYDELIADNADQFRYRKDQTGGSTGEPMRYLCDENVWGYVSANKIAAWKTTGYRFGDSFMALGSASIFNKCPSFSRRIIDLLRNEHAVNSMNLNDSLCEKYIEMLRVNKIRYIYGYASAIFLLAQYVNRKQIDMSEICGVFTTSENLTDVYRETIEDAFGCKVMDCYGARDAGVTAYEISPHNYHLGYGAYCEVVDSFEPGKGTLLSTNLLNMVFPLLRYSFGDVAELDNACPAYNGQVIHSIYGRTSSVLRLDNGHVLTSPGFTILMRSFDVVAFDIQKLSGANVKMLIQTGPMWDDIQEKKLFDEMYRYVGPDCEFSIEYVDGFPTLKNGKRRYFMNDLSM